MDLGLDDNSVNSEKDQWMSQCVSVWETGAGKIWPLSDNHQLQRVLVCLFKTSSLETLHRVIYWWKYLGGPIVLRLSLNFQVWHPHCPFVRCNLRGWFRPPSVDCNYLWHFSSSSLSLSPSLLLLLLVKISTLGVCQMHLEIVILIFTSRFQFTVPHK